MKRKIAALAAAVLTALVVVWPPAVAPAPPPAFGWVNDPAAVAACAAGEAFAGTDAYRTPYRGPDDVFLWEACKKVTGGVLPARDQGDVGSCVAFGTAAAVEHLICVQAAGGARDEFREVAQEVIYGGSRVEIGGGRIGGDGSIGAWAARFVTEYGVVPRGTFGPHDLRAYSTSRCREYGRTGVPDDLEPVAKKHPVRTTANVRSWAEARAAIRNGYPVAVCSSQGFGMTRDADGFCRPQGTWMHCMALVGVRGGSRPGGFLLNSWGGTAHPGPRVPADAPAAGFWCDAATLDRMLAQGDSWAFSGFAGFPARKLDWYAGTVPSLERSAVWFSSHWGF